MKRFKQINSYYYYYDSSHDKRCIYHCNKALITDLRSEGVEVQHVHYFSDGPSSQFKNK